MDACDLIEIKTIELETKLRQLYDELSAEKKKARELKIDIRVCVHTLAYLSELKEKLNEKT